MKRISGDGKVCYRTEVQSEILPRHTSPGWGNWRNKESLPTSTTTNITPNENQDIEVYYELAEDIPNDIVISNPKTISQEEFDKIN